MAYSTSNPPLLKDSQPIAGPREWIYKSTHTQAVVGTSDHISEANAGKYGMAVGDPVTVIESTAYKVSNHSVTAVGTTYVSLSAGLLISSAS